MVKRVVAVIGFMTAVLGSFPVYSNAVTVGIGLGIPHMLFWSIAIVTVALGVMALISLGVGEGDHSSSSMGPVLLRIGLFFPVFVYSLPFTMFATYWSKYYEDSALIASGVSSFLGVAVAVTGYLLLLKRRRVRPSS